MSVTCGSVEDLTLAVRSGYDDEDTSDGEGHELLYDGAEFTSVNQVIARINEVRQLERYGAQTEVLERMMKYHHRSGDLVEESFAYMKESKEREGHVTKRGVDEQWEEAEAVMQSNQKKFGRREEAKKA